MRRSLTIQELAAAMGTTHIVHFHALVWRMQCLGHRLLEFGWEPLVDHLEPHEAIVLAATLPPGMQDAILSNVLDHGAGEYESLIRSLPQFAEVSV